MNVLFSLIWDIKDDIFLRLLYEFLPTVKLEKYQALSKSPIFGELLKRDCGADFFMVKSHLYLDLNFLFQLYFSPCSQDGSPICERFDIGPEKLPIFFKYRKYLSNNREHLKASQIYVQIAIRNLNPGEKLNLEERISYIKEAQLEHERAEPLRREADFYFFVKDHRLCMEWQQRNKIWLMEKMGELV